MCSMRKIDDFARDGVIHPSAVESSQAIRQPKAKMKELMSRQSFNEWTQQKRANERLLTLESPVPRCQSSMLPSVRDPESPMRSSTRASSRLAFTGDYQMENMPRLRPMTSMTHKKTFDDWYREKDLQKRQKIRRMQEKLQREKLQNTSSRQKRRNDLYSQMQLEAQWFGRAQGNKPK